MANELDDEPNRNSQHNLLLDSSEIIDRNRRQLELLEAILRFVNNSYCRSRIAVYEIRDGLELQLLRGCDATPTTCKPNSFVPLAAFSRKKQLCRTVVRFFNIIGLYI